MTLAKCANAELIAFSIVDVCVAYAREKAHNRVMPLLDFWFDFASTYSYPAAMRIAPLAQQAGVTVRFRPFLLGPLFKGHGIPQRVTICGGTSSGFALISICRFGDPNPFHKTAYWLHALR